MFEVKREFDPSIIDKLKDNFVEDGSYSRDVMAKEFKLSMRAYPDDFFVVVSYDDFSNITGHIVAFKPNDREYIVFDQVWHKDKGANGKLVSNTALQMLIDWSKAKKCQEIRCETSRRSVAEKCLRFLGFEEKAVSMRLDLTKC